MQLAAQEAKAWARIGDRRQTEVALDKGPASARSHAVPGKPGSPFRRGPDQVRLLRDGLLPHLADDQMAETLASEVIQASTDFDGTGTRADAPCRSHGSPWASSRRARGDLEQAIHQGQRSALSGPRKSLPSLLMVSRDLTKVLNDQYPKEPETQAYLDQLHALNSLTDSWSAQASLNTAFGGQVESLAARRLCGGHRCLLTSAIQQ